MKAHQQGNIDMRFVSSLKPLTILLTICGTLPLFIQNNAFTYSPLRSIHGFIIIIFSVGISIHTYNQAPTHVETFLNVIEVLQPMTLLVSYLSISAASNRLSAGLNSLIIRSANIQRPIFRQIYYIYIIFFICTISYVILFCSYYLHREPMANNLERAMQLLSTSHTLVSIALFKCLFIIIVWFHTELVGCVKNNISKHQNISFKETISFYKAVVSSCDQFNDIFNAPLGLNMATAVMYCITSTFFYLTEEELGAKLVNFGVGITTLAMEWIVYGFCDSYHKAISTMYVVVHDTMEEEKIGQKTIDQNFSLFLTQQRNELTVYKMFALQNARLGSIATIVANYTFILIQFKFSEFSET